MIGSVGEPSNIPRSCSNAVSYTHLDVYKRQMLTGEALPVSKRPGDTVAGGTVNQTGTFVFRANRVGEETVLAQIIAAVRQAQNSKPPIGRLADQVAAIFVPTVLIIAVLTALVWFNFGPQPPLGFLLVTTLTVLIIACPCACLLYTSRCV